MNLDFNCGGPRWVAGRVERWFLGDSSRPAEGLYGGCRLPDPAPESPPVQITAPSEIGPRSRASRMHAKGRRQLGKTSIASVDLPPRTPHHGGDVVCNPIRILLDRLCEEPRWLDQPQCDDDPGREESKP